MKPPTLTMLLILAIALPARACFADAPATQPADPAQRYIARWIDQLSDNDAIVRDHARFELMGLTRDQLPLLRQAVIDALPLSPGQQSALRDVVLQDYLATEPYDAAPTRAFLGLQWFDPNSHPDDMGTPVHSRLPGFCAYRYLHDGDIILKLPDRPEINCRDRAAFVSAVAGMAAGDTLRLRILRQGRTQDIPLVLDHAPAFLPPLALPGQPEPPMDLNNLSGPNTALLWMSHRREQADDYWRREFAPIMTDSVAAVTMK